MVQAKPLSPVSVELTARGHRIIQDKPHASGGHDHGLMASELVLAGLLACQHSTFVKVAAKRKVAVTLLGLRGEMDFQDGDVSALRVHYTLSAGGDIEASALDTLLRLTDKTCTVSRLLKLPVHATYERA